LEQTNFLGQFQLNLGA